MLLCFVSYLLVGLPCIAMISVGNELNCFFPSLKTICAEMTTLFLQAQVVQETAQGQEEGHGPG